MFYPCRFFNATRNRDGHSICPRMDIMNDPNGLRYTNEYLAQEYRNEAASAKSKVEELLKENAELKLKIAQLEGDSDVDK